jgi:uncharacterized protein YjbI with pentapeptide repeats
MFVPGLPF